MGKRAGGRNRKKQPNIILEANNEPQVNQVSMVPAYSVGNEKNSGRENVLQIESPSEAVLPTSSRRSTRASTNVNTAYECQICHMKFSKEFNLRRHLDYYGDPSHLCKECGTKFTGKSQLQSHKANAHGIFNQNFTEKCIVCKQTFMKRDHLRAHLFHYHENWKEYIKPEESAAKWSSTDMTVKDPGTPVEIVSLSLPTDSTNSIDDKQNKINGSSRVAQQVLSPDAEIDDLLNKMKSQRQSVDTTRKDEILIPGNRKSYGLENSVTEGNQMTTPNNQVCSNDENNEVCDPNVVDKSHQFNEGVRQAASVEGKEKSDVRIEVPDNEENSDEPLEGSENTVPQTTQFIHVTPGDGINEEIKSGSYEEQTPVGNETTFVSEEKDVTVNSPRCSNNCLEADVVHRIQVTEKNSENNSSLDARSGQESTTCVVSEEKAQENSGDKVRDYEEESKLRRLHSCKDCYVPLERIKIPQTSGEEATATAAMTQPHIQQSHAVIPSIVCDRSFSSKDMMLQHYQQHHLQQSDGRTFCVCGKMMNGSEALDFHFYRFCQRTVLSATKPDNSSAPCQPLEKKHRCTGCDKMFWLQSCLRSHTYNCTSFVKQKVDKILSEKANIPTSSSEQVCVTCNSAFRSAVKLSQHKKLYSGTVNCQCAFCGTMFFGERQLKCHMVTAHNRNTKANYTFECTICNQRFPAKRYLRMHAMHIHREKVFENIRKPLTPSLSPCDLDDPESKEKFLTECNVCKIVFSNEKRYIDHTIYYMKSEIIDCKTCDEKFEGQYTVHHHNKAVHYSEDMRAAFTYHCDICKEGFMYMTHLQAHMHHVHTGGLNTTTAVGKTEGNRLEALENSSEPADSLDQRTDGAGGNVAAEQHACTVCDVKFPTADLLAAHEMTFMNDGEYLCNRCSRKCRTPAVLLEHVTMNHSNNVQCGITCRRCNENFLTQRDWVSHVKHFHNTVEPSEFDLEKNVASIGRTRDNGYELIPTNESISSGVTYLKVKHSIDFPASSAMTNSVIDANKIDSAITESKKVICDNDEKIQVSSPNRMGSGFSIAKSENDVSIVSTHKEQSTTINGEQAKNVNLAASSVTMDNPEKKKATSRFWRIPEAIGRISDVGGWNCSTCGYAFRGPSDLARHMSLYSNSGPHMCDVCSRSFEVQEFLRVHKIGHTNPNKKAYFCAPCNEGFRKYQAMKMHTTHYHPKPTQSLFSDASDTVSVPKTELSLEAKLRQSRANAQQARLSEVTVYRPILPSIVKTSVVRTYSRKQIMQPLKVGAQVDAVDPKDVKLESPELHTEIFGNEISLTYACPTCQERHTSVKQLNEHVTSAHGSGHDEKKRRESSKSTNTNFSCDVCHKVFENNVLLNGHRKKLHFIKSVHVVKSSNPVLEVSAPIDVPKCSDNVQPPVVVGRLYRLEKIDILPTALDHGKNDIRQKFTVENISCGNGKHEKILPITTVRSATTANALPPIVADTQLILQKLNMGKIILPEPDVQNLPKVDQQHPPSAKQQTLWNLRNPSNAQVQNRPSTERPKKVHRLTLEGSPEKSVLKRVTLNHVELPPLVPIQVIKPIKIVKVESCKSVNTSTSSAVARAITTTAIGMPQTPQVSNAVTRSVAVTPSRQFTRNAIKTVANASVNLVSSKAKTVVNAPVNSVTSKAKIISTPPMLASINATRIFRGTTAISVSSSARKTILSTPINSVLSNATKAVLSTPVNLIPHKAAKTLVTTPVNSVSNKTTKSILKSALDSVSRNVAISVVSPSVNSVSCNVTKAVLRRTVNAVKEKVTNADVNCEMRATNSSLVQFHCQYTCNTCNIIFMNRSQFLTHNIIAHPWSPSKPSINNPALETSTENPANQLRDFVSTFPEQPESAQDTQEQEPFRCDFESVLIPVSADDLDLFEDESAKSHETETDNNLPKPQDKSSVQPNHHNSGPLKVRSFAKIVQNLKRKNDRKRNDNKSNDIVANKRPKSVFDPVAYEELCRQHNIIPPNLKSQKSTSSSNIRK